MTDRLPAFLQRQAARPFAWGTCDCCLFAADWVCELGGVDPAAAFRGRYASERGAMRLLAPAGGLVLVMAAQLSTIGIGETATPYVGDVGVIDVEGRPTAAIRVRSGWACKGLDGIVVTRATLLRAWSLA